MRSSYLLAVPAALALVVPAAAQQTNTSTTAFDNWVMGCTARTDKDNKTVKACEVRSTLVIQDKQTNQQGVAAVVAIGRASTAQPDMQFVAQLPINAVLNVPVQITGKDGKSIVDLAFTACQPQLCTASAKITDAQLAALRKVGDTFIVSYRNQVSQDPVQIEGSTKGFSPALDALIREK